MDKLKFPIKIGEIIDISTSSYSDRTETRHKVLKEINQNAIDKMHSFLLSKTESHEWKSFDYEYVVPYLVLNGYISEPIYVPFLNFGYETHITERDYIYSSYDKEDFEKRFNELKSEE
jgi:hypothetical protein